MGMFDTVEAPAIKCPKCGAKMDDWQSKSGFRRLLKVTPEQLIEDARRCWGEAVLEDVNYYDYCNVCGQYVEFYYVPSENKWEQYIGEES